MYNNKVVTERTIMGYTTEFKGRFELNKEMTRKDSMELEVFADLRHEGDEFPGIWCQWVPTKDGLGIEWDGNEKFYNYVEWLKYLIEHFFTPKGYVLEGTVQFRGEEFDDVGKIMVNGNHVTAVKGW
jgi:hypothetical protein